MSIMKMTDSEVPAFLDFCRKHRADLDDSFLSDDDLAEFSLDETNPAFIALDDEGQMIGAASLVLNDYARRGRKARLRILHAENGDPALYGQLLERLLPLTGGLDKLNIFVPLKNRPVMQLLEQSGFAVERYSYILVRDVEKVPEYILPPGYTLRPLRPGMDEERWCHVRNTGFSRLQGSETPVDPGMVRSLTQAADYLEGGLLMLFHGEEAVGIVRGSADEAEGRQAMSIGPLALLPEHQGKGLGRILLKAAVAFAHRLGYSQVILCVNAENDRAKALYLSEGFREADAAVCLAYRLNEQER
ncbi:GNAT family N-acetyltransferase [Paenibacillus sp. NFR01]|uniref:GNAT family N-acetyltransferase n=1 Tax=Paenibacillus sp. NFR01 TaxID=1566279 RepID=UPI0008B54D73|nr:GNAT family N-acetyltransferase [Paenibacillus sp. NFR01]SET03139.1 mycothiol synthase [Paenibacillus sp. NFR01]